MTNDDAKFNTDGGASVGNNVQTGGDFVGRDQTNININVFNWSALGSDLIKNLNDSLQREQKKKEEIDKKQHSVPDLEIQSKINWLTLKITELDHFDWQKAEKVYLDKVIALYDNVRMLGNSVDVPLGTIFTQVYILDKPTARQRHDINELSKNNVERQEFQRQPGQRIHGIELVRRQHNLFILGKPGAGKTTFLKYIAIQAAHKQLQRIPIFVSLNQWADSKWGNGDDASLLPFLVEQFEICGFPEADLFIDYLLNEGRAIVLFDGLDEVKQEQQQRRRLTYILQNFARKFDKSQHLITCRIAASEYSFVGFADVEMANFTMEQVHEYAHNWFGERQKNLNAFINELARPINTGLAELCNTPLLLSLLCLTFDTNLRFPPNRSELYEDALETLLRKWDSSRQVQRDEIYRDLSYKRKLQLLMSIAVPTFERGEIFFRQRELEQRIVEYIVRLPGSPANDILDGTTILKSIESQHSILVERAQGIYSFSHLTFQEYLTARYLAENQGRGVIDKLIASHLTDPRWREVFLLTASLLDNESASEFIAAIRHAIDALVANESALQALLTWADGKAKSSLRQNEVQHFSIRQAYITLDRILDFSCEISISRAREIEHALSLDIVRSRALMGEIDIDLALDVSRSLSLDRDLSLDRARSQNRARSNAKSLFHPRTRAINTLHELSIALSPSVGLDYGLYFAWGYAQIFAKEWWYRNNSQIHKEMNAYTNLINSVSELAQKCGKSELSATIAQLPNLVVSDSTQYWHQYANHLFLLLQHCDIVKEWRLNSSQISQLSDYLTANELLFQCIKVAMVSDRQEILDGLLLPLKNRQNENPQ